MTDLTYLWEIVGDVYLALSRRDVSRNTNVYPPSPPSTFCREKESRSLVLFESRGEGLGRPPGPQGPEAGGGRESGSTEEQGLPALQAACRKEGTDPEEAQLPLGADQEGEGGAGLELCPCDWCLL